MAGARGHTETFRVAGAELGCRLTAGRRMLPGFLVIGGKRCGSTSLFEYILRHPAVLAPRVTKGTHYFDVNYPRGRTWFRSKFPTVGAADRLADRLGVEPLTGEASPYYLSHPCAPGRIAAALPQPRLIAVLRNPVERAWSHYRYSVQQGFEDLPVDEALDREAERLAGEEDRLRRDPDYAGFSFRHYGYFARGLYARHLTAFYDLFPAEHVLVLRSEDLFASPHAVMDHVFDFLALPPTPIGPLPVYKAGLVQSEMPVRVRKRLEEAYADPIRELRALAGVDFEERSGRG